MDGIPPAHDTDAEDVAWALQTAEALWKRSERGDAIVWLRRAAQAAAEADNDDRALALARAAAELTESFARSSSAALSQPPVTEGSVSGVAIDTLLQRSTQVDPSELAPLSIGSSDVLPDSEAVSIRVSDVPTGTADAPIEVLHVPVLSTNPSVPVPSAAESHAGMLDPWSESDNHGRESTAPAVSPPPLPSKASDRSPPASEDGVFTSAPPSKRSVAPAAVSPPAAPKAPPRPAPPKPPLPKTKSEELVAALPLPEVAKASPSPARGVDKAVESEDLEATIETLDLSSVEAFSDLPDDSRDLLAKGATVRRCVKGEVIESFALAFVVRGDIHVAVAGASSHATTLGKGTVLLGRGTLDAKFPLQLLGSSSGALVATWEATALEAAMGSCPWVEEELRKAGDRVQALAGVSLGALGDRLSPELRTGIVDRLTLRTFGEHETIVTEGLPLPGILLVAGGDVELVASQAVTGQVLVGQFVLPAEALSAGPSPSSARAGPGGALVFAGDRKTTQELFATEPLLLELFAGW